MGKIVAIANQKGGVGKTTTAINLASSLAVMEKRILIIDIDPQANATSGLGFDPANLESTIYDVLLEKIPYKNAVQKTFLEYLDVLPANQELVGAEIEMVNMMSRETRLSKVLKNVRNEYEYIFIDCPPSLNLLTVNSFTAGDSVLIPIQCEYFALEGLTQLLYTIRLIQRNLNAKLDLEGIVLTMYDSRLNLSKMVAEEVRKYFGDKVYQTVISRNVRLGEAPSYGQPIISFDIHSSGAINYMKLAEEFIHGKK
ncbi:MAG: AAA family ATPase [Candidatus Neomarinimicrobiota bacterium]|jgi:chromosome partitioning protein|nr:AAA family ATPase [Candidatus Neomarinimicrobiota bacterium]MDD3966492.1 AAA family ATPase [Candidatus Neomarinimicrobiota bacterium]